MAKYDVDVQLTGVNGNAVAIVQAVTKALKKAKVHQSEINQFRNQALAGNYDNVLQTAMQWVNVE